jgi:hypothetical protein
MHKQDFEDLHPDAAIYRTLIFFISMDTKVPKERDTSHFIPSTITPMLPSLMHEQVSRCLEVFRKCDGLHFTDDVFRSRRRKSEIMEHSNVRKRLFDEWYE